LIALLKMPSVPALKRWSSYKSELTMPPVTNCCKARWSERIAGRSLQLKRQDLSIAALELETDPIDLDPRSLGQRQPKLKRPFQVGVRLVLT